MQRCIMHNTPPFWVKGVFISQQGGSYKRSTLFMMTAVAIRKTGVISDCALGNQPVSTAMKQLASPVVTGDGLCKSIM